MKLYRYGVLGLSMLIPMAAFADFQYQETTQITGGSMLGLMKIAGHFSKQASQANEPIVSTVYVQGNRMARVNAQTDRNHRSRCGNHHQRRPGEAHLYANDV